jgi:hypothetical protein
MAIIKITDKLLFKILQEFLMLPNPVTAFMRTKMGSNIFAIITEISGFGETEDTQPIYHEDKDRTVRLIEIRHRGQ